MFYILKDEKYDAERVKIQENTETVVDVLKKFSSLCTSWNQEMEYQVRNCNCQHFVNDALEELNMMSNFDGEVKAFFDKIKKGGTKYILC